MTKVFKNITLFLVAASLLVSCEAYNNSNKTQRGAVIGAAGGAILGAILGNNVGSGGNSELGAVIGTAVGGAAGAVIGNQMDRQAKKIEEEIPGAEVKRVDDGIVVTSMRKVALPLSSTKLTLLQKQRPYLPKWQVYSKNILIPM